MIVYADTSALMKLLLLEDGSAEMLRVRQAASSTVTVLPAYAELRAGLAAATRSGRLSTQQSASVGLDVERLWSGLELIPVDDSLVRQAGELAQRLAFRGYDAVHLAALLVLEGQPELTFACWDAQLSEAARTLGYQVIP